MVMVQKNIQNFQGLTRKLPREIGQSLSIGVILNKMGESFHDSKEIEHNSQQNMLTRNKSSYISEYLKAYTNTAKGFFLSS